MITLPHIIQFFEILKTKPQAISRQGLEHATLPGVRQACSAESPVFEAPRNARVARDVYAYNLHYLDNADALKKDYTAAGGVSVMPSGTAQQPAANLYNGNIPQMITTITDPNSREVLPLVNRYQYDQLNRLVESNSYKAIDAASNAWTAFSAAKYNNKFTYDANGKLHPQPAISRKQRKHGLYGKRTLTTTKLL